MKKTLSLIMAAVLLLICVPALATAPGETATVSIKVTTSGCYASIGVSYDTSVLEYVSASGGTVSYAGGNTKFIFGSGLSSIGTASGSITFRVKAGAPAGTYNVSGYVVECYNTSYGTASCSVSGGSVVVSGSKTPETAAPTYIPGDITPKPTSGNKTKSPYSTPKPVKTLGKYILVTENEDGEEETAEAEILVWGLARCEVLLNGVRSIVDTKDLLLSDKVRADEQLAVIYAPNKGHASLRKAANKGSKELLSMDTGVIVPILEKDGDFCRINYLGTEGYVLATSLRFYNVYEEYQDGEVAVKSGADAALRLNRDNDSIRLTKLPNRTSVYVLKEYKDWYEVDYAGYHGFIIKKNIQIQEE